MELRVIVFFTFLMTSVFSLAFPILAEKDPFPLRDQGRPSNSDSPATPAPTTQPQERTAESTSKILVIHKPMPSPSWGKLVQYRRDQILALSEKNRETLHEFVFQDSNGIVRTATYHESDSGDGFWEVLAWDQP